MNDDLEIQGKVQLPEGTPDRETLRVWMSALLDGELDADSTEILYTAFEHDESLLEEFEAFAASLHSQDAALSAFEAETLTNAVLAATTPEALDDTEDAACRLASAAADDELSAQDADTFATQLFVQAEAVEEFLLAQEAVHHALNAAVDAAPSVVDAVATATSEDERLAVLLQAAGDDLLTTAETDELDNLLAAAKGDVADLVLSPMALEGIGVGLNAICQHPAAALAGQRAVATVELEQQAQQLAYLMADDEASAADAEAYASLYAELGDDVIGELLDEGMLPSDVNEVIGVSLAALADHPDAKRAGEAALQAIAAEQAQVEQAQTTTPAVVDAQPGLFTRIAEFFHRHTASAPVAFAAAAALLFVVVKGPGEAPATLHPNNDNGTVVDTVVNKTVDVATQNPSDDVDLGPELAVLSGDIDLLNDNSAVEVEALEAGSPTAMVFSTEASNITVIWVGELDDGAAE